MQKILFYFWKRVHIRGQKQLDPSFTCEIIPLQWFVRLVVMLVILWKSCELVVPCSASCDLKHCPHLSQVYMIPYVMCHYVSSSNFYAGTYLGIHHKYITLITVWVTSLWFFRSFLCRNLFWHSSQVCFITLWVVSLCFFG